MGEIHPLLWAVAIAFLDLLPAELDRRLHLKPSDCRTRRERGRRPPSGAAGRFLYHRPRCSNGPRCLGAARDQRPASRRALGLHRGVCPGRFAPGDRSKRPASRTSWSTSPSRARRPTRRPGRSPRRSRASAARSTPPRTASRPSTGCASRGARRRGRMDVLGELIVRPTLADARDRGRAAGHRRGDPLATSTTRRSTARSCSSRRCSGTARSAARSAATRPASGRCPRPRSASSGRSPTGPPTSSWRSPATSRTTDALGLVGPRVRDRQRRVPGFAPAPELPAGKRYLFGQRDATQAQLAVGVPALHRDHPDSWILGVLNTVLGDGMSSRLFLSVREELGLAYDVGSGLADYADAGASSVSAGVDPGSLPAGARGDPRRARPAARRAGARRGARQGQGATCPAASSCGWTRPAISPRGSAARRRSTTRS